LTCKNSKQHNKRPATVKGVSFGERNLTGGSGWDALGSAGDGARAGSEGGWEDGAGVSGHGRGVQEKKERKVRVRK